MTIQEVLAHFNGVRGSGKQFTARCPAHEDGNASLSIGVTDDQAVLLRCHAGCENDAVLAAAGLKWRDLFPANGHIDHPPQIIDWPSKVAKYAAALTTDN